MENGHIDVENLMSLIKEHNANTYNFLIGHSEHDWDDLKEFLSLAEKEGIDIWITITPPGQVVSQPYGTDYAKWAEEIAKLSAEYPCIKAWSIDNILLFMDARHEGYMKSFIENSKRINPKLEFIPVVYFSDVTGKNFEIFKKYFDGVQFYYKVFPTKEGFGGYQQADGQISYLHSVFDGKIILGIYATPWQDVYPTTANYVRELIKTAKKMADGAMIYTLQREGEKMDAVREQFK